MNQEQIPLESWVLHTTFLTHGIISLLITLLALSLPIHKVVINTVTLILVKHTLLGTWHAIAPLVHEFILVLTYTALRIPVISLVRSTYNTPLSFVLYRLFYALTNALLFVVLLVYATWKALTLDPFETWNALTFFWCGSCCGSCLGIFSVSFAIVISTVTTVIIVCFTIGVLYVLNNFNLIRPTSIQGIDASLINFIPGVETGAWTINLWCVSSLALTHSELVFCPLSATL